MENRDIVQDLDRDIAIVGISIFCPAGDSIDEFWQGIARGGDFITEAPKEIIEPHYFSGEPNGVDRFYCNRGGFCKPFKADPIRYGIMPIAAGGIDPDQLISMAGVEQALIDAGIFEKGISLQNTSIIIGKGNLSNAVQLRSLEVVRMARQFTTLVKSALPELTDEDLGKIKKAYQDKQGRYQADMAIGAMSNLIASLVANRFDMHGPAYTLDAACASGIIATDHSVNLLRGGRCDVAVAGGIHILNSAMFWGVFDMLGALSHSQVISPFSENADGLLIGQGAGFVVLKTLRRALEDNDRIYALIKETSVCSDGAAAHVMTTSVSGQTRALEQAWKHAKMDPDHIGYIEAHGTATGGDKTEITTLKNFFGDNTRKRAYVGSVKSNIGHTMSAAGMIGLIKTALALHWRQIPPTLHCERPLAAMFESRFMPPQKLIDWDGEQIPLVAGVNAFGFGGIDAHAIMTAYEPRPGVPRTRPKPYLGEALMVSAVDGPTLIAKLEEGDFTDTGGHYRLVLFDPDEARIRQAAAIIKHDKPCRGKEDIWFTNSPMLLNGGKIVFLFPEFHAEWNSETDSISDILDLPRLGDLMTERDAETDMLENIMRAHYTGLLCKTGLEKLGVEADMYAGQSVGEWDAAIFAGIVDGCVDELKAGIAARDPAKNYPAVVVSDADRQMAETWCKSIPDLWLSSDNCPSQIILCGAEPAVADLVEKLEKEKIAYTLLPFGAGWHTPLIADELPSHENFLRNVRIQEGRVPVWSSSTLGPIPTVKEQYAKLFAEQLTKPVYFREMIQKLYDEQQARIFIQIGLGSLTGFVEDILRDKDFGAIAASVTTRGGADQLRRVMALHFIEGRPADAAFLGVKPMYRTDHSLLTLSRGIPDILTELPELNEAIERRYGTQGPGAGIIAELPRRGTNSIAAAANENIRGAITVQQELTRLFEQRMSGADSSGTPVLSGQSPGQLSGRRAKAPGPMSRTRENFEETLHLTLDEHPYLLDHAIVRQPEGWPFPGDLDPVVPLTMTIELLAEIAMKHAPDEKLIKIGNIMAYHWIKLEKPFEAVVKGKWIRQDTLAIELGEYARAEYTFGDAWPEPPAAFMKELDIGADIITPCPPAAVLYDKFSFHGPQYQSKRVQSRICERGMQAVAEKQAGKGSLLDIMGQQLGLFLHLTQTENTISFPIRLKELHFFSDIFDQEGVFEHTMLITRMTSAATAGDMVLKRGGKVWSVAREFVAQRFVNISLVWNVLMKPCHHKLSEEIAPGVCFFTGDFHNNVLSMLATRYLAGPDKEIHTSLSPKLQKENAISRIALKDAVRSFTADGGEMLYPIEFYCAHDENGKPSVCGYGRAAGIVDSLYVSLAHKGNASAAIAARGPVGIDLEIIEEKSEGFLKSAYTDKEIELLKELDSPEAVIRFWVAKEACAKKTGFGLRGNPKRFEVCAVEGDLLFVRDECARANAQTIVRTIVRTIKIEAGYIVGWTEGSQESEL
ncbi:MAG: 4'-phosphopantetheinyl transferase superfamily protein [Clostridiales bacterium]|nr:4'-phosphopantetheinyl transferase superfamily protein [Clostridiales bacterium]